MTSTSPLTSLLLSSLFLHLTALFKIWKSWVKLMYFFFTISVIVTLSSPTCVSSSFSSDARLDLSSPSLSLSSPLSHLTTLFKIWISRDWTGYHAWEDGRGNYAWDIGALNSNMMSYSVSRRLFCITFLFPYFHSWSSQASSSQHRVVPRDLVVLTRTSQCGERMSSCQWLALLLLLLKR